MPTTSDLNIEQNFITQWMSSASRAGVILNPSFSALETISESPLCRSGNISVNSQIKSVLISGSGNSINEDSLHEEEISEANCFYEESDTVETVNPLRASHWAKKGPMIFKDAPIEWEDIRTGDLGSPGEEIHNDPLLQKLEQLKERQQEKQDQLKKKQMEQIQRLMEEQKKLLVLVSGQKTLSGENSICDEPNPDQSLGEHTNSDLHAENDDLFPSTNGKIYSETAHTEERPILSGIKETKQTFEEFLDEQIKLEEQRMKQRDQLQSLEPIVKPVVKRPFLKRGAGLARFTDAKSKLSKSKAVTQQRTEDKNAAKMERPQLQRKSTPVSKEQLSENVVTIFNQIVKPKNSPAISTQKIMVLKNINTKNPSPLTIHELSENKLDGQLRNSLRSEISSKLETNKDDMEHARQVFDVDSRLRKNLDGVEKLLTPTVLTSTYSTNVPSKNPEYSFELSFQKRSETWEKEKEKESLELDEFLLFEQAAEDVSFSSNSSFVFKLLAQDQQINKGRRMSSTPVKLGQQQHHASLLNSVATDSKTKQGEHATQANKADNDITRSNPDFKTSSSTLNEQCHNSSDKLFQASCTDNPSLKSGKLDTKANERNSVLTSNSEDDLDTTVINEKYNTEELLFTNREDNPNNYDCQVPSKNISKECKSRDQDLDLSDQEDYNNEDFSMSENKSEKKAAILNSSTSILNGNDAGFDDDRTWADLEENEQQLVTEIYTSKDKAQNGTSIPDKVIKRKVASIKKDEQPQERMDSITSSPLTSDLMMKLFPALKPKQKCDSHMVQDTRFRPGQEETKGDTFRSQLLKKKLVELETEIERFKIENASLAKLREEREQALETLRKEVADFEQQKAKELARIEDFKKEEMKKLQKERKVFEKYATAARAIPDKKERDEIQALKQQLVDLQEELKRKEARWSTTHIRLRNQIEAVTKENAEMRQEIKVLEKIRLETWKKAEAPENDKEIENRVVLKRVESSSPLNRIKKSQTPSPGSVAEKSNKTNCRSHSPAKAKSAGRLKSVPVGEPDSSDKIKVHTAELPGISLHSISSKELSVPPKTYISGIKGNDEIQEEINYADGKEEAGRSGDAILSSMYAEKAFDKVVWHYLFWVLQRFGISGISGAFLEWDGELAIHQPGLASSPYGAIPCQMPPYLYASPVNYLAVDPKPC
ncbi:centromere protein J-like [Microcaecilia unicolor]|uniref:Centromere protein J-like n=1 Tax=Microcaecilia unicolor TaxID=1415580 RepID=A0A6P7XZE6_9AMPH|nr:centromere protein J-like [Microcaecilia unicolor]